MPEVHSRHNRHLGESEEEKLWRGVGVGRPARRLVRGVVDEYVPVKFEMVGEMIVKFTLRGFLPHL